MSLNHPAKDQLIAFGQGKLAADESSSVEQHLEVCRECCETLLDLKDDTFIELVKIAQPSDSDRRMGALARPSEASSKTETDHAGTGKSAHPTEAATLLMQSGEAVSVDDLPAELQDHPRYRIVELIGRGGMGNVYRAEHRLMNRPVAIKLINSQLIRQPQAVERFRREVQAAAKLTHPNIVTAYDAEQAGDVHFLVMEFVEGTDLASVVKHRGPMSVAEACECIRQAATGLQHAHERGMVHRDIKPHNLMLSCEGQVRILDFGLAGFASEAAFGGSTECNPKRQRGAEYQDEFKTESSGAPALADASGYIATAAHLTTAGSVMGTPDYIAPEQAVDAHSADIRADIYSLGCTLHFLLTGKPPFEADNVLAKLKAHSQETPPALAALRKDVPAELSKVATRMLAKNPAERFQTPAEVVAALLPFTQMATVRQQRMRKLIAAALLGMMTLLAGVLVIVSNRGRLEIHSEVEDVKVSVTKGGEQVEVFDLKTGSQMKWLPSGEYELQVVGKDNDVKLDKAGFTMSRLGKVIVTANWNAAGSGVVRAFSTDDQPITQDGVVMDDGGWKITAAGTRTVRLFEVPNPNLDVGPFFFRAKLKTENVTGRAYLEMWNRFPGKGEFFSKGIQNPVSGTTGWAEYEIPFFLKKGEQPDLVKLNVTVEGTGAVWIKDIELRGRVIGKPAGETDRPPSDEGRLQGKWIAVSGHARKKPLTAAELAQLSITFDGERVEFVSHTGPATPQAVTFTINSNRDPKQIDFVAPGKQESMPGIYQFDGDRLKLALIDQDYSRPTNFDPDHRPDHLTAVFERVTVAAALSQEEQAVLKAAEAFLAVADEGDFDKLYDIGANLAKKQATREQVVPLYRQIRDTAGKVEKRSLRRVQLIDKFLGLPPGRYAAVQYASDFEKHKGLWETVMLNVDDDGQWRANTYAATVQPLPLPEPKRGAGFQPAGSGKPLERQSGSLPHGQPAAVPTGANLITDPSFENTGLTLLPRDWRAWTNEDSDFRCEVVNGGRTGQRSLRISGKGIRGVVFANDIKADRSKRYALKGWAKFEGDKDARAIIKFNYFRGSEFLGVHDLVGVTVDQPGWHLFEKTDALDAYPQADHFYAMCHVEGSGTGWFDDLELIAYDRDKLPADFDTRHGRHNRLTGPNSLERWVGAWETEYAFRETDNSPKETKLTMTTSSERLLGDYFLVSHSQQRQKANGAASVPRSGDLATNVSAVASGEKLLILSFDQNVGAFRQWLFSSNGKSFESRGQWDEATQTLELRMLPDASNMFASEHFVNADRIEVKMRQQFVMGSRDVGRWTTTRKAATAKVDVPTVKAHAAEPAELALLDKLAGEWAIHGKSKPSVWRPEASEERFTEQISWILGGRFLMARAFNEKGELTSIWIATYEPLEKSNHAWFFNADGSSGQWRVTWDATSRSFQWHSIDMPTGWTGTALNRLIDDDTFDNQALIKDENGRVMLDMTQDKRRKK